MGTIEQVLNRWQRVRTRLFTMLLSGQFASFGKGSRIEPPLRFHNLAQMSLGERVIIHRDCWLQVVEGDTGEPGAKLVIGSDSGIGMGATLSAAKRIEIGEHVLLARNVYISDHRHAFDNAREPIASQGIDEPAPVSIGRHSWLCQNVCVLPGVTIGEQCVIGANSVVRSSIPDYSVAVGAPARVVRRFNFERNRWESLPKS